METLNRLTQLENYCDLTCQFYILNSVVKEFIYLFFPKRRKQ